MIAKAQMNPKMKEREQCTYFINRLRDKVRKKIELQKVEDKKDNKKEASRIWTLLDT